MQIRLIIIGRASTLSEQLRAVQKQNFVLSGPRILEKKKLAEFIAANPSLKFDNWPEWAQLAVHDDVAAIDMGPAITREIPAP